MLENIQRLRQRARMPVLILDEANLRYYTEVGALAGALLIDKDETLLTRDLELAKNSSLQNIVKVKDRTSKELSVLLKKRKIKKLGVAFDSLSCEWFRKLQSSRIKLVDVSKVLSNMRAVKTEREIGKIRGACELADKAMKEVLFYLKPGVSERELRTAALSVLSECEDAAFSFIVASGPNSEYTHVYPSERRITKEDFVIVDLGVRVDGYCSDLTRTFCIGPTREQKEFYSYVMRAQEIALGSIYPGAQCKTVCSKVENFFKKEDLLRYWKYSLGHGVGLDVHEPPYLSKSSKDRLKNNMTFTVEPGIHIPDFGGVRIEDTVLLDKSPRKLTNSEYSLEV